MRILLSLTSLLCFALPLAGPRQGRRAHALLSTRRTFAETGHCSEALPLLTKTTAQLTEKELQTGVVLDGVRRATLLQQQEALLDMLRVLNQHSPHDPEVLHLTVHAYSDLSSNAVWELAQNRADNDGWMDMYLVNSGKCDFYNPIPSLRNALYRKQCPHLREQHHTSACAGRGTTPLP